MSTHPSTIDYIIDQTARAGEMRARKMFGEYALCCNDKNDQLGVRADTWSSPTFYD